MAEKKFCKNCGAMRLPDQETCYKCGYRFVVPASKAGPQMKFCRNCGKSIRSDAKFCKFCGYGSKAGQKDQAAQTPDSVSVPSAPAPKSKRPLFIAVAILTVLALAGTIIFIVSKKGGDDTQHIAQSADHIGQRSKDDT